MVKKNLINEKHEQMIKSIDVTVDGDMSKENCEYLFRIKSEEEKLEWKSFGMPKTHQEKVKFAKVIIAMSNTNGGWILLGKEETGNLIGITESFLEIADLSNIVNSFVQPEIKNLKVAVFNNFKNSSFGNKNCGIIFVPKSISVPHITTKDGNSINKNTLYVRHSGQSEPAAYHDYQRIIRECVILKKRELLEHLEKSQMSKDVTEIKSIVEELLYGKKRIKKKKEIAEDEIKALFLDDKDFINNIKNIMEENEQ